MVENQNNSTIDLQRSRLTLRDDLIFVPQPFRGQVYYHVESKADSSFYRIGYSEYVFLSLLDGNTTFAEALALSAQKMGAAAVTSDQAMSTYLWILQNKLGRVDVSEDPVRRACESNRRTSKSFLRQFNPFWLRLPLGRPDRALQALLPSCGWIFSFPAVFAGLSLIAAAMVTLAIHWERLLEASDVVFSSHNWWWMGVTWIVLKLIHELAHGIACRRHGCEVKEVGLVFILLAPMAYVDVTPSWRLPSKWQRIQIAAAGMYVELVIAAIAALLWLQIDGKLLSYVLFNLLIMASVSTVAFNANPLMRFDGYFILSDLLEIPNLYEEGVKAVGRQTRRLFFGQASEGPRQLGAVAWFISIYGWAAAIWRIFVCISLALVASVLFEGAGIAIAAVGVGCWYGPPLVRLARSLSQHFETSRLKFYRGVGLASAIFTGVPCLLLVLPVPFRVSVPGIVDHCDAVHLRSKAPGFIEQVAVRDGEQVVAGQLVMELENPDVSNVFHDLLLAIQQTQLRRRIALDEQQIALAQVEQRNQLALEEKLAEARTRHEALTVRAAVTGKVMRRSIANLENTFVHEGEILLSIGNEHEKEVIVSVAQTDFDSVVPAVGKNVRIRCCGKKAEGKLVRLEPRASLELTHEALAAPEGGPLTIVQSEDQDGESIAELAEPRFRGVVVVSPAFTDSLFSGQRCQVVVGWRREPLAVWIAESFRDWMSEKLSK